jgi:hypothetical protein
VWDMQRRPAGIIMGGNGINGCLNITYAQPLERLLNDIRAEGFNVSVFFSSLSTFLFFKWFINVSVLQVAY